MVWRSRVILHGNELHRSDLGAGSSCAATGAAIDAWFAACPIGLTDEQRRRVLATIGGAVACAPRVTRDSIRYAACRVRFLCRAFPAARIDATGQADQIVGRFFVRSAGLRMRLALTTNLPLETSLRRVCGRLESNREIPRAHFPVSSLDPVSVARPTWDGAAATFDCVETSGNFLRQMA